MFKYSSLYLISLHSLCLQPYDLGYLNLMVTLANKVCLTPTIIGVCFLSTLPLTVMLQCSLLILVMASLIFFECGFQGHCFSWSEVWGIKQSADMAGRGINATIRCQITSCSRSDCRWWVVVLLGLPWFSPCFKVSSLTKCCFSFLQWDSFLMMVYSILVFLRQALDCVAAGVGDRLERSFLHVYPASPLPLVSTTCNFPLLAPFVL